MRAVLAIDPGTTHSAYVAIGSNLINRFDKVENKQLLKEIARYRNSPHVQIVIEQIKPFRRVAETTMWTVWWYGRFHHHVKQIYGLDRPIFYVPRATVKRHFSAKNDSAIRKAMIDRWGWQVDQMTADEWQALAVGSWALDQPKASLHEYTATKLIEDVIAKSRNRRKKKARK